MTFSDSTKGDVEKLFADLLCAQKESSKNLPTMDQWNPKKSGDMDLIIDREGRWIHEGREIKRAEIVKLFSTILRFEEGNYYLVSPVEKWQIQVAIAPFYIIDATRELRDSAQAISLRTSTDDIVVISRQNPLILDVKTTEGETIPLVRVRDNLTGFFSRSIYYQLMDWGQIVIQPDGKQAMRLESMGEVFILGEVE